MRALLLLLIAGVVALGMLLAACGGDDEQQVQQAQEQTEQAEQTQQSASGATAERASTGQAQQAQESAAQQVAEDEEAQPEQDDPAEVADPLLAEALAAYEAWSADLETLEMVIDIDLNLGGLSTQLVTNVMVRLEPFMALTTIDASSLFAIAEDLADDQTDDQPVLDEPLLMQVLISQDTAYLSMPQFGGWIDLSDQFEEALAGLTAMLGTSPDNLANPDQFRQAFDCIDAVGGSVTEGSHDGEDVWLIECLIDVDALNDVAAAQLRAQGIEVTEAGIESMYMRLGISQATGAPVLVESDTTLRDAFGLGDGESDDDDDQPGFYVSTVAKLVSWNEPVEFPTPEPLVDGAFLGDFGESDSAESPGSYSAGDEPPELLTQQELLELASVWAATADELHIQFLAQAVIDGEPRLASTIVRESRTQGAFETVVNIDDASTFRLLWNRDGIWTSDSEENGEPVWAPSTPALLGFAGMTVDQFLANPDRLNLGPLHSLLEISWLTRTVQGNLPPIYDLVIESGPLAPGDPLFDLVAEILKDGTAELLAESVVIESIDHYSTVLTIQGDDGELMSQVSTAEFQTGAGRAELVASLTLVDSGVLEFSRPMK